MTKRRKNQILKALTVIAPEKDGSITCYDSAQIKNVLTTQELASFNDYITGQTGAIIDGKMCFYTWDFDRWLDGKPVID